MKSDARSPCRFEKLVAFSVNALALLERALPLRVASVHSSQPCSPPLGTSSATATLASRRDPALPVPPSQSVTRGPLLMSQSTTENSHDFLVILKDHRKLGDNRMSKSTVTYNTALLPRTKAALESLPLSSPVSPWGAPYPGLLLPAREWSRQHREHPAETTMTPGLSGKRSFSFFLFWVRSSVLTL